MYTFKTRIYLFLFLISSFQMFAQDAASCRLTSGSQQRNSFSWNLEGVTLKKIQTPQGAFTQCTFQNSHYLLEQGMPEVPIYTMMHRLPAGMEGEIVMHDVVIKEIQLDAPLTPSKGNLSRLVDPAVVPYMKGSTYEENHWFPKSIIRLGTPFIMHGAHGVPVHIQPVLYHPKTNTLQIVVQVDFEIIARESSNTPPSFYTEPSPAFQTIFNQMFINNAAFTTNLDRSVPKKESMLVLCVDSLVPAMDPYVRWKMQSGIDVTVTPMSQVGTNQKDTIYKYLHTYYNNKKPDYLLLVGDEFGIDPLFRPGSDWSCDHCFGYHEGNDNYPDILVGRFHARNVKELGLMVTRQLDYESTPLIDTVKNWATTGCAVTSNEGVGIGDDGQADYEQGNEWKSKHLAKTYKKYWEFYDGSHADISPTPGDETADKAGNPTQTEVFNEVNGRGVSLFNYTGHGFTGGLATSNFNTTAAGNLTNDGRWPIFIVVGCCSGNYTQGNSLGEALQRAGNKNTGRPYGAIASLQSSDYQSWAPPMEGQDGMNQYLVHADTLTGMPNFGAMAAYGNALMIAKYGQGGIEMADVWNPFADPSLLPRTATPKKLDVTHVPNCTVGTTQFNMQCSVNDSRITLWQSGVILATGYVVNGQCNLTCNAITTLDTIQVTGINFNYIPYKGIIIPQSGSPAFLTGSMEYQDSQGDNDLKADHNEILDLDLHINNVGLEDATAVTATLRSVDPNALLLDTTATVNLIGGGMIFNVDNAFQVKVKEGIPNLTEIAMTVHLTWNNGKENDLPYTITAYAPQLKVSGFKVLNTSNGNKYMEANEQVTFQVLIQNVGGDDALNTLTSLTTDNTYLTINSTVPIGDIPVLGVATWTMEGQVSSNTPWITPVDFLINSNTGVYATSSPEVGYLLNPIYENYETNDFNKFLWGNSGDLPWVITDFEPYEGTLCAKSGAITHNQISRLALKLNVLAGGDLSFALRTSTDDGYDFLRFYDNGVKLGEWTGNQTWKEDKFPLSVGEHQLVWTYEKDEIVNEGLDAVFVDDILFPLHSMLTGNNNPNSEPWHAILKENPTSHATVLSVTGEISNNLHIELIDIHGRVLLQHTIDPNEVHAWSIPVQQLGGGMYFIHLNDAKHQSTLQFWKSK